LLTLSSSQFDPEQTISQRKTAGKDWRGMM